MTKAPDQQLLGLGLHLNEGLRRQLLGQEPKEQRQLGFREIVKDRRDVRGVHGDEDIPEGGVLLALSQGGQSLLQRDHRAFCHWYLLPYFFVSERRALRFEQEVRHGGRKGSLIQRSVNRPGPPDGFSDGCVQSSRTPTDALWAARPLS